MSLGISRIAICQELIAQEVIDAKVLIYSASMQNEPKLHGKAEKLLKEHLKANSRDAIAYITLADCYDKQGKIDLAKNIYEKTLLQEFENPQLYSHIINFYIKHNYFSEAKSLAELCISKFPEHELQFKNTLVIAYIEEGEFEKANQIIKNNPELMKNPLFKNINSTINLIQDPKRIEMQYVILDKIDSIDKIIQNDPFKYSYIYSEIYPYFDLNFDNLSQEELQNIYKNINNIYEKIK
jgi:tetratricopeptide (TPR) repeat protein